MAAKMETISPDSAEFLCDQVNRLIRAYKSGHVSVQVATTMVPVERS